MGDLCHLIGNPQCALERISDRKGKSWRREKGPIISSTERETNKPSFRDWEMRWMIKTTKTPKKLETHQIQENPSYKSNQQVQKRNKRDKTDLGTRAYTIVNEGNINKLKETQETQ